MIEGVGKDAPMEVNKNGAKQSKTLYRFDLLDPKAMFEMTKVLQEGAISHGEWNWRKIPVEEHLNRMIIHAYAYLAGDKTDEHLSHAMCRAMFAQAVALQEDGKEEKNTLYSRTCDFCSTKDSAVVVFQGKSICRNCLV